MASNDDYSDNMSGQCSCEVKETPEFPHLPLGLIFEQNIKTDISLSDVEIVSSDIISISENVGFTVHDFSTGLKDPPLYLINASFLI